MSSEDALRDEIAALRAEVAALKSQVALPRLGPRNETAEEEAGRAKQLADRLRTAIEDAPPVDRSNVCTTNGQSVADVRARQTNDTGQHEGYIVLCAKEREKGFVRPYRDTYRHDACGTTTKMGRELSETYARDPSFYSHTFSVRCNRHLPVNEFTWVNDGQSVGS